METIEDLMKSKYVDRFEIEYGKLRTKVLSIHKPEYIGICVDGPIEIQELTPDMLQIKTKSISLTLYYKTQSTHSTIF